MQLAQISLVIYALIYLGFAYGLKLMLDWWSRDHYDAAREIAEGNTALALRRGGVQLGLAIAMIGVLGGDVASSFWMDIVQSIGYGIVAVAFMWTSLLVVDKLLLPKIDNMTEMQKGNTAVGFVEAGALIMTGLLARASIAGESGGLTSSLVFFVVAQVAVLLLVRGYELVQGGTLLERIKEGEVSSGILLGGKIVAYGMILQVAILGDSQTLEIGLRDFVLTAIMGMVLLYAAEWLIDKYFVTHSTVAQCISKNQVGTALQFAMCKIGVAVMLSVAVL